MKNADVALYVQNADHVGFYFYKCLYTGKGETTQGENYKPKSTNVKVFAHTTMATQHTRDRWIQYLASLHRGQVHAYRANHHKPEKVKKIKKKVEVGLEEKLDSFLKIKINFKLSRKTQDFKYVTYCKLQGQL